MTREDAVNIILEHRQTYFHANDIYEALDMAIKALQAQPEWTDQIGEPCYKIYVNAERTRFPKTRWDYFIDTKNCLKFWKRHISLGGEATLYVRERPFTKSDKSKIGSTVFWTKEEAEAAIGIERREQDNEHDSTPDR